ncbi:MAG: SAM-dependent methyltransferase [Kiritimatiellia bacterium]
MPRTELPKKLVSEIRQRVFNKDEFLKITQVSRRGGGSFKISLRPVVIRGESLFQGEMTKDGHTQVKNFSLKAAENGLLEILNQTGPRDLHLMTASGDLHIRVTKKGKVLHSYSAELKRPVEINRGHDHVKKQPLTSFDSDFLLKVLGIATADGKIKPSCRPKYDQVNEFLKVMDSVIPGENEKKEFYIVDCGCGKAYLTFAAYFYLTMRHGLDVKICGVDHNEEVIRSARKMAADLDVSERVTFIHGELAESEPGFRPDMTISLHACDTATDEALARGIEWKSRCLLCAPCCQHELHKSLKPDNEMRAVLRHGILRERLADLLTDTLRAQILRILGFRVNVIEFVSQEATARNIMLKAEYGVKPGRAQAVSDYLELRDYWHVSPWLENRMAALMNKYLKNFE